MRILLWNVEWATQRSKRGKEIQRIYREFAPDIACITEGYLPFWQEEGNVISSTEDYGYKIFEGRRKVILVSTQDWDNIDDTGSYSFPSGRYCFGRTHGLDIHGVCIPWKDAHVRTGKKNRQIWEDHIHYLDALKPVIRDSNESTIVLGDFNQRIPRKWSPESVYRKLLETFSPNFTIDTIGTIKAMNKQAIDHFASTNNISVKNISVIDNYVGALQLSDHFGFVIEI